MKLSIIDMIQLLSVKANTHLGMRNKPSGFDIVRAFAEHGIYRDLSVVLNSGYGRGLDDSEIVVKVTEYVDDAIYEARWTLDRVSTAAESERVNAEIVVLTRLVEALATDSPKLLTLHV